MEEGDGNVPLQQAAASESEAYATFRTDRGKSVR